MSNPEITARALALLKQQIATENDSLALRELVIEINGVLDLIEQQLANIQAHEPPPTN